MPATTSFSPWRKPHTRSRAVSNVTAFDREIYDLGGLTLKPLSSEAAEALGPALAAMPPWSVIGTPAGALTRSFQRTLPSVYRFEVLWHGDRAGLVTIQSPFLLGPYLQLLAVLPA